MAAHKKFMRSAAGCACQCFLFLWTEGAVRFRNVIYNRNASSSAFSYLMESVRFPLHVLLLTILNLCNTTSNMDRFVGIRFQNMKISSDLALGGEKGDLSESFGMLPCKTLEESCKRQI